MSSTCEVVEPVSQISFEEFCKLLENLYKNKKAKQEQGKILSDFFNDTRLRVAGVTQKKNSSFYSLLRLLLPGLERERGSYNLKEAKLGDLLVKVLSLSKQSNDARKLTNFRSVSNSSHDSDFAGVAYFVLKNRIANTSSIFTIGDINDILDKIANAEVGKKEPILDEIFSNVIRNVSAGQMKWFLRLILKDLKLDIGVKRILAAFHPDAPEFYENCGDVSKVCEDLEDGNTRPLELGVQLFYPVSPMLLERLNITKVSELSPNMTYIIEEKWDGERFQIHMESNIFEYFSRKGHKYSHNYGKTYESGLLTPSLKDCFSPSVVSFILDGEMMGWHKHKQEFSSKGMSFDVKTITENSQFRPCFCAFDILYYNGKSLVGPPDKGGLPLCKRLEILDKLFRDVIGAIYHSKRQLVTNNSDILEALNKTIENQKEGITVKEIESYYIPNHRNAGWYKIKSEYTEGAMTDLDVVIIGADESENKAQGLARSFYVACIDNTGVTPRWLCMASVSLSGLRHDQRAQLCASLEPNFHRARDTPPAPCLHFHKQKPDFWLLPEKSIVLQVRASELIRSTDYGTPYTLRFQRIIDVRADKPVHDVMTLQDLEKLVSARTPVVKLGTKTINQDQIDKTGTVLPKKRTAQIRQVSEQFRTKISEEVLATSRALLGRKICVLSDDDDCNKAELVRIIKSHSGKHEENHGVDTWCCVAGRITYPVRRLINQQTVDIVSTRWLRELPASDQPCTLQPLDMLAVTTRTRLCMNRHYDRFGDSYTEYIDEETLRKCFEKVDYDELKIYLTKQEKINVDKELFDGTNPYSYLRSCVIAFPDNNSFYAIRAQIYGASLCELNSGDATHVIIPKNAAPYEKENARKLNDLVVTEEWLEACFKEKRLVPVAAFLQ